MGRDSKFSTDTLWQHKRNNFLTKIANLAIWRAPHRQIVKKPLAIFSLLKENAIILSVDNFKFPDFF